MIPLLTIAPEEIAVATARFQKAVNERSCGECDACCTALHIAAFDKPMGTHCPKRRDGGGCGIYGKHPDECRGFYCMWRLGEIGDDESLRPDRCGIVFQLSTNFQPFGIAIEGTEARTGAISEPDGMRAIAAAAGEGFVVLTQFGIPPRNAFSIAGNDEAVKAATEFVLDHLKAAGVAGLFKAVAVDGGVVDIGPIKA